MKPSSFPFDPFQLFSQSGWSCFINQVSEYFPEYRRVFDAGNDANITTARADRHARKASCSHARKPPYRLSRRQGDQPGDEIQRFE
jgi:hypothetical protein